MRARLPDLEGKYYYSTIEVEHPKWGEATLELAIRGDGTPSEREEFLREHPEEICDWHYETQATYDIATAIVEAINEQTS